MKRAVIFANGNMSNFVRIKKIISKNDYIIGVDGGSEHAIKEGFIPNVIIGDFDSISLSAQKKLSKHKILRIEYPQKKDKTDFELAIEFALKKKYKEIIICGLLGNRVDHFLANIFFLKRIYLQNQSLKVKIIEGNQEAVFTSGELELYGKAGDLVSLIPLDTTIKDIEFYGLEYKLKNESLFFGSTRGVSNVMIKKSAKIIIKRGTILVVYTVI